MRRPLVLLAVILGAIWLRKKLTRQPYEFKEKVVLITGGSRGLGLTLARQLARAGAHLVLVARDQETLERAKQELLTLGGKVLTIPADITDPFAMEKAVQQTVSQFGRLDILINSAGTIVVGALESMTLADYHEAMDTNFFGSLHSMLAVRDVMKAQGGGRIVNIVSIGGKVAVPHLVTYNASKFALAGLSTTWRAELLKDRILVTTVYPGLMQTGSPRNANFKGQHRKEYTWFALSDHLPFISQKPEAAAKEILQALRVGKNEVVVGTAGKIIATCQALFPNFMSCMLGFTNRFLPSSSDSTTHKGYDSETFITKLLSKKKSAEVRHNQVEPV